MLSAISLRVILPTKARHSTVAHPSLRANLIWYVPHSQPMIAVSMLLVLEILMHHIRATLPDIKARITSQLQKYNAGLQSLGGPLGDGDASSIALNIITDFT